MIDIHFTDPGNAQRPGGWRSARALETAPLEGSSAVAKAGGPARPQLDTQGRRSVPRSARAAPWLCHTGHEPRMRPGFHRPFTALTQPCEPWPEDERIAHDQLVPGPARRAGRV